MTARTTSAWLTCAWLVTTTQASAQGAPANPGKQQCITANETAQSLRAKGQLRAAREQLQVCIAKSCPGPVSQDCAQRLNDVELALPTVVFIAKDANSADLTAVQIKMDGAPLVDHLDGSAIAVDPGEHVFELTTAGYSGVTKKLVVYEGVKGRGETVVFTSVAPFASTPVATSAATRPPLPSPHEPERARGGNGQRIAAYVVGGAGVVGLGLGTVFGLVANGTYHDATAHCPTNSTCDSDGIAGGNKAHTQATISTVAFVAGGALLAGGVVLFLTAPKRGALQVQTAASPGSFGLRLGGAF